ncbi:MAG: hypothetical protein QM730_09210 [Anaerolineales bacterium]
MHELRCHVGYDDDQLTEVIGVGSDARNNASGGELVIKGKVVFRGSTEGACSEIENNITHRAHHKTAPCPVQAPQPNTDQQQRGTDEADGGDSWLTLEQVHHIADNHRQGSTDKRQHHHQSDRPRETFFLGLEVTHDAPRQFPVGILAVIFFVV